MEVIKALRNKAPLIHCITNTVSVNDCANALLAIGAKPIMAEHPLEVYDITRAALALLINLGTISDTKIEAMKNAVKSARDNKIPYIIDCVGISSSRVRYDAFKEITSILTPDVIKGNASEIKTLVTDELIMNGVDSASTLNDNEILELSKSLNSTIFVTGECDRIALDDKVNYIRGGSKMLRLVTGTGCMLGAICAAMLSVTDSITACTVASRIISTSDSLSNKTNGTGTFRVELMDNISKINDEMIGD